MLRNVHRILTSSGMYLSGNIARTATTFLVSLLIARFLGPEGIGVFSLGIAVLYLGVLLSDVGINTLIMREFAGHGRSGRHSLGFLLLLRGGSATVIAGCIFLIGAYVFPHARLMCIILAVLTVSRSLGGMLDNYLKARLRVATSVLLSVAGGIMLVILVFAVLSLGFGLDEVFLTFVVVDGAGVLILLALCRRALAEKVVPAMPFRKRLTPILAECLPFALIGLLTFMSERADIFILATLRGSREVGLFSAADRFLRIGVLADSSLLASSLPILSSITDPSQHTHITRQTLVVLCVLSILCAIALYITAPVVVSLTFRFDESVPLLRILSVSLPAVLAHSVLRTSLFARRQERAVALLFGLACTVNIVLNIATIPQFGATGAAVVSAITEYMILGMYGVLYMRKAVTGMPAREHESMAQPEVV